MNPKCDDETFDIEVLNIVQIFYFHLEGQINQLSIQMNNFSTKKDYTEINMEDRHKSEMSWQKLSGLLILLGFIWILCYNAELQFPMRHISDTYDRIGDRNITHLSLKYAEKLLNNSKNVEEKQMQYLQKKYHFQNLREQEICVILIHKSGIEEEMWMKSVQILLQQDYANYKIYYINNYEGGQKVYSYIQENSLNKQKIKLIDNIPNTNYAKQFEYAKNYCSVNNLVVYMYDEDQLIGRNVFATINSAFTLDNNLKFLYSASLVPVKQLQEGWKYDIGRSYPYPEQVVKSGKYENYPFIVDGLITFRGQLFNRDASYLMTKSNQPFKKAGMMALGLSFLQAAKQSIRYLPEPLVLKTRVSEYITLDKQLKGQIEQIYQKYRE